jgi:hypothetical protein
MAHSVGVALCSSSLRWQLALLPPRCGSPQDDADDMMTRREALELVAAFYRIKDKA